MDALAILQAAYQHGITPTVVQSFGACVIVVPSVKPTDDTLIPIAQAAGRAQCSVKVLRRAIRSGELAAFGKQRSRTVRSADLHAWIESRRVSPSAKAPTSNVDDDIERRMRRLERSAG